MHDLRVTFSDKVMVTPIYIKMDAQDQLLLSEGVCSQLGIVQYHPEVEALNSGRELDGEIKVNLLQSIQECHCPSEGSWGLWNNLIEPLPGNSSPFKVKESVLHFEENSPSGLVVTNTLLIEPKRKKREATR